MCPQPIGKSLQSGWTDGRENSRSQIIARVRLLLGLFMLGLVLSGATAIPLETELRILTHWVTGASPLATWLERVRTALVETDAKYPFLAYGTDWMAFGHFMIAVAFIGPLRDPVKNVWVVEFGMVACLLVVPFALVMGGIRGIPFGWRLIDCSFGVFGIIPLWLSRRLIRRLADA